MIKTTGMGTPEFSIQVDPSQIRAGTFLPGWEGMTMEKYLQKVESGKAAMAELQAYEGPIDSAEKMERVKIIMDNMLQGCPREVRSLTVIDTLADEGTGEIRKLRMMGREGWSLQDAVDFWQTKIDPEARFQSPPEEVVEK